MRYRENSCQNSCKKVFTISSVCDILKQDSSTFTVGSFLLNGLAYLVQLGRYSSTVASSLIFSNTSDFHRPIARSF